MLGLALEPSLVRRLHVIFQKASLRMKSVKEVINIWLVRLPLWQYPKVGREVSVSWSWVVKKQITKEIFQK